ncbi:MAG TPA: TetR/AcrR family transcriptional regulator [Gaiellaceae bacterium]|nr:TetR/AcrR family transcriptional regulator [Gaiellaceae bacterium]
MPKVSDEHKAGRRRQILDGARRVFSRHGYEGATVALLEEEIGLSRGAVFNYFPNKEAIFVELAVESNTRLTEIWLTEGYRALLGAITHEDPDWLGVQLEAARRFGSDEAFRKAVSEAEDQLMQEKDVRLERLRAQGYRSDVDIETIAVFLSLVANGMALRRTLGDPMPDLDALAELVDRGVARRRTRKKDDSWPKSAPRTRRTPQSPRRSSAA